MLLNPTEIREQLVGILENSIFLNNNIESWLIIIEGLY